MTESGKNTAATQDGMAHFYLIETDLHRGEMYAVFKTIWEGREMGDIGVRKDGSIAMKEYVKITVIEINKIENGLLVLKNPPRSNVKIKLKVDGGPVPGYPEVITVKVGQTLTVQSTKRALEASGLKKVRRI